MLPRLCGPPVRVEGLAELAALGVAGLEAPVSGAANLSAERLLIAASAALRCSRHKGAQKVPDGRLRGSEQDRINEDHVIAFLYALQVSQLFSATRQPSGVVEERLRQL